VAILDRLDSLQLRATFFVLGERVSRNPGLARELDARGHEVATHGHRHESHFRHTRHWVAADLQRSIDALAAAGLAAPRWFRPPYGHVTSSTVAAARSVDLPIVLWSAMGGEWRAPTSRAVAARLTRAIVPGGIVLLHDAEINPGSARRVHDALPMLADSLSERGWCAAPLCELLGAR
jgi:peptidoglycan/xylan/chitin deacetylase (PgdA/CDA1 family)